MSIAAGRRGIGKIDGSSKRGWPAEVAPRQIMFAEYAFDQRRQYGKNKVCNLEAT